MTFAGDLSAHWHSCVYAFFKAEVKIETTPDDGRRYLAFRCAAKHCKTGRPVRRYLDKGDQSSGNLFKHARTCWGDEAVDQAQELGDATRVRGTLVANILQNGAITEYFAPAKKGAPTYSSRPLTKSQTSRPLEGRDVAVLTCVRAGMSPRAGFRRVIVHLPLRRTRGSSAS